LHLNTFKVCPSPWNFVSILSDGRLFACCGDIEPVSLESFSFDDIYNHELLRKLRYLLLSSKKMPKVCKNCFYGE
jgi:radical SAM protein with 4Fe4S-binding SPASM domain